MVDSSFFRKSLLFITIILTGCYSAALALDWPDWVHGSNWVWGWHVPQFLAERWGWLAACGGITLIIWWWTGKKEKWSRSSQALLLWWAVLFTPLSQFVFTSFHMPQPIVRPVSMQSGFFQQGVRLDDPVLLLQTHLTRMPEYRDVHVRTQPPGWLLAYWATSKLWGRFPAMSDAVGRRLLRYDCLDFELQGLSTAQLAASSLPLVFLLLTGLGALPFYGLGRRFLGDRLARRALVFYPFWPGLLVFIGRFDAVYAMLALLALWLAQVTLPGELKKRPKMALITAAAFGICLASGTWFSFGTLSIALLVNCVLLAQIVLGSVNWRDGLERILLLNGCFLAALIILWGSLWLFLGVNGPTMFMVSQELHAKFRLNYPVWPLFNLYDLAVFMGIILFVGTFLGAAKAVWSRRDWQPGDALAWGWLITVLLLNLSGQVRAETGRLWLLLMGPGMLAGIWGWHRLSGSQRRWETAVFVTFWVQAIVTVLFLGGRTAESTVSPPLWDVPARAMPLNYQLGETVALQGYELRQEADMLYVNLYWRALDFPRVDYSVMTHLVADEGSIIAQNDGGPHGNNLPTWCWVPGEVVTDERVLPLAGGKQPYQILVGMYDWRTGQRLSVTPSVPNNAIPLTIPWQ